MTDVETLLEYSTRQKDEEMRSYSEKNWNLALWNNQKTFVSHPFIRTDLTCGTRCHRFQKWVGKMFKFEFLETELYQSQKNLARVQSGREVAPLIALVSTLGSHQG